MPAAALPSSTTPSFPHEFLCWSATEMYPMIRRFREAGEGTAVAILHLLFLAMIVSAVLQVVSRYIIGSPLAWTEEITRIALVIYTFLGAATAMRTGRHPRFGDLVDNLFGPVKALVDGVAAALIVVPTALVAWYAIGVAARTSETATSFPLSYSVVFGAVAVSLALVILFFLASNGRLQSLTTFVVALVAVAVSLSTLVFLPPPDLSQGLQAAILVGSLCVFIALGVPIGFALLASSVLGFWLDAYSGFEVLPRRVFSGVDSFLLIAIPFFLMAGELMNRTGITTQIVAVARALVGHMRGGLAQVNIVTSFFLGGLTGSSSADCAALGKFLIPEMTRQGYRVPFSAAVTASSSILANLVPPSINLLIYASLASTSVGALFIAGILPALVLTGAMMLVVVVLARRHGLPVEHDSFAGGVFWRAIRTGIWALGFPVIIVFGIRGGVFTPTEAAAVAVVYAITISIVVFRNFPWRELRELSRTVAEESAVILFILAASAPFAWLITVQQVPQAVAASLGTFSESWFLMLLLINVLLIVVGLVLSPAPAMVILIPILLPLVEAANINLVHFGIIIVANLFVGSLTPPIGNLTFIAAMVSGAKPSEVFQAQWPFIFALLIGLLLITYVPAISLWLPSILR